MGALFVACSRSRPVDGSVRPAGGLQDRGITTLKTTYGRIPAAGDMQMGAQLTVVDGPMTRHVADLWTAFEVMAGPTWRDPRTVPAPLRGPQLPAPVRVAVVLDPAGGRITPQVQDGVRTAAAVLADAGYAAEETEPPGIDEAAQVALSMLNTPDFRALLLHLGALRSTHQAVHHRVLRRGRRPRPGDHRLELHDPAHAAAAVGRVPGTWPLVAPICTNIPFKVGTDLGGDAVAHTIHDMRMAIAMNALGLPAVAVPVGVADGLPQVVQIIGPRYREDLVLDAAAALEHTLRVITPIDPR